MQEQATAQPDIHEGRNDLIRQPLTPTVGPSIRRLPTRELGVGCVFHSPPPPRSIVWVCNLEGYIVPGRSNTIPAPPGSSRYWKLAALDAAGSSLGCSLDAGAPSPPGYTNRNHDTGLARTRPSRRVHVLITPSHPLGAGIPTSCHMVPRSLPACFIVLARLLLPPPP